MPGGCVVGGPQAQRGLCKPVRAAAELRDGVRRLLAAAGLEPHAEGFVSPRRRDRDEVVRDQLCSVPVELRLHAARREDGDRRKLAGGSGREAVALAAPPTRTARSRDRDAGSRGGGERGAVERHGDAPQHRQCEADDRERAEQRHLAANSVVVGAISIEASSPSAIPYASRALGARGAVFGSVIMKKRKTSTSGEVTSTHQK